MLVTLLVVVLVVGLALYGVELLPINSRLSLFLQLLIIIIAIIYLAGML